MIETLQWEPLFTYRPMVAYDRSIQIGATPLGGRSVFPVEGGTVVGPQVKGVILPGGADFVLWRQDGAMIIDVRTAIKTDDGALIYMTYNGLAHGATPDAREKFKRREVIPFKDLYARTTFRFETADERYDWMNRLIAVGNGTRTAEGPLYHVFSIL